MIWFTGRDTEFNEVRLARMAERNQPLVIYSSDLERRAANACAKAVAWGFQHVYYFENGLRKWKAAGYTVARGNRGCRFHFTRLTMFTMRAVSLTYINKAAVVIRIYFARTMNYCSIKEIKAPDGRTLYLVISDPKGRRLHWRHIFESRSEAEKCKHRLDSLGEIPPPNY